MREGATYFADCIRCAAYIFFLSFKPLEPHITKYLVSVKHFTHDQVNVGIYPVYTYTSVVLISLLAVAKAVGFVGRDVRCPGILNDKAIIVIGCGGRLATELLLLFGEGLGMMQLMQVVYSLGTITKMVFSAYVLKVVASEQSQRLTAITQTCYLVAHTSGGFIGDFLLARTDIGLLGLSWMGLCSVSVACLIACSFRNIDTGVPAELANPRLLFGSVYRARNFWMSSLWWTLNYSVYVTIYGYEASLYAKYLGHTQNNNGSIFAAASLMGAAAASMLSSKLVERILSWSILSTFTALGLLMTAGTGLMGWYPQNEWMVALSFVFFIMSWSLGNTLFYGETRRAVDAAVSTPEVSEQILKLQASSDDLQGSQASLKKSITLQLVSVIFMINAAIATLMQSVVTAILFTFMRLDIALVFRILAVVQLVLAVLVFALFVSCALRQVVLQARSTVEMNAIYMPRA